MSFSSPNFSAKRRWTCDKCKRTSASRSSISCNRAKCARAPAPIGALFGKQSDGHQMHHHGQVRMRGGGFDLGGEIGRQRRQRALAQAAHHRPQRLRGAHIFHFGIGHLAL